MKVEEEMVIGVVELLGAFSEIIWAIVLPTREAKKKNLRNKVGLIRIGGIILIKLLIALKGTTSLPPHYSLLNKFPISSTFLKKSNLFHRIDHFGIFLV